MKFHSKIPVQNVFGALLQTAKLLTVICIISVLSGFKCEDGIEVITPKSGITIVKINTEKAVIIPYMSDSLETISTIINKTNARIAINAGFFDPLSKETMSYVLLNGQIIGDPTKNSKLMTNTKIQPYLDGILNRSEFRIIQRQDGGLEYAIAEHNTPVIDGCKVLHSVQAGPMLIPSFNIYKEAFVDKKNGKLVRHAADVLYSRPRTALGLKGNYVYLITVTDEASMKLDELAKYLKKECKLDSAIAFDGGSSTSMAIKDQNGSITDITAYGENTDRRIKSALLIYSN